MESKEIQFAIELLESNAEELRGLLVQEGLFDDVRERLKSEYSLTIGAIEQLKNY